MRLAFVECRVPFSSTISPLSSSRLSSEHCPAFVPPIFKIRRPAECGNFISMVKYEGESTGDGPFHVSDSTRSLSARVARRVDVDNASAAAAGIGSRSLLIEGHCFAPGSRPDGRQC